MNQRKMETCKNRPALTLRRHSTSPSSAGRAVIASMSRDRPVERQTLPKACSMKSNPYVGWFRHSPSTAPRVTISHRNPWYRVPSSLVDCKNSPHIGWFRHAPPSQWDLNVQTTPILLEDEKDLLWKLLQELNPALDEIQRDTFLVSGYLRGGGKEYLDKTRHRSSRPFVADLRESSAQGTISTVNALSRLASWFLFPVAHDAESCGYRQESYSTKKKKTKNKKQEEGIFSQLLSPYLPSFLEDPPLAMKQDDLSKYGARVDSEGDCEHGDDDSYSSSSDSSSASSIEESRLPSKLHPSKDMSLSVSSLAEAYYAHQTATKELSVRGPPSAVSATSHVSHHRLDYVITQMDIARMTRNASRHLDVHSILSLPVITYHGGPTTKPSTKHRADLPVGWSWTIVEESEGGAELQESSSSHQPDAEFCVICLEHFVNGDRLRLLPCDHSFHVGCIDRWLSGSQSFEECYTSGCPTCKKRPTAGDKNSNHSQPASFCQPTANSREETHCTEGPLDGSVPSWAFAQIGSALVAQDQGFSTLSCS